MSVPPRVLCRTGCGDFGDPELAFFCGDCHGDKIEMDKQKALLEFVQQSKKKQAKTKDPTNTTESPSPRSHHRHRRGPAAVDHHKAFDEFMARPRETNYMVVARECSFLEREQEIRETSKRQLRRFMVATDTDEPVDPKEWGRYQYGEPRNVPRHDVDHATEMAAQIKLFCSWRKRTVARKLVVRKQQSDAQRKAQKEANKALTKSQRKNFFQSVSKRSSSLLTIKSFRKSVSVANNTDLVTAENGNPEVVEPTEDTTQTVNILPG